MGGHKGSNAAAKGKNSKGKKGKDKKTEDKKIEDNKSNERPLASKEQDEQFLLPGIPDEITLKSITTKLHWTSLCSLSSVSKPWKLAIQTRRVLHARVHSNTAETLVVHSHSPAGEDDHTRIALYSMRDNRCYNLPPVLQRGSGFPWERQFISMEGTIHVVGCKKVDALDPVGQRQWRHCASLQQERLLPACGAIGGKIYTFGGHALSGPAPHSEVYDPKVNAWSRVMSRPPVWEMVEVSPLGEELLVYSGVDPRDRNAKGQALSLAAYHPVRDEWRTVHPFGQQSSGVVFMAKGKFYMITGIGVHVHDSAKNSWRGLHVHSFPAKFSWQCCLGILPYSVVVVNDELIMGATWYDTSERTGLFRSKGFCGTNRKLVWEEANCPELSVDFKVGTIEL